MARLFGILVTIVTLSACSSGVSNSGAGAAGTNCGAPDMVCFASLEMESFSIDAFATDTDFDGFADELITADFGTLAVSIRDPIGRWINTFQGITIDAIDLTYDRRTGGPALSPRRIAQTFSIELSGGVGDTSVVIPVVDLATKREYRKGTNSGTVHTYMLTVRMSGRDFATNSPVVIVARAPLEFGDFQQSPPTPPSEDNGEEE